MTDILLGTTAFQGRRSCGRLESTPCIEIAVTRWLVIARSVAIVLLRGGQSYEN
jgi:hypothetical protein